MAILQDGRKTIVASGLEVQVNVTVWMAIKSMYEANHFRFECDI
jgi:hypothetical protein